MAAGYPENQNQPFPAERKRKGPKASEAVAAAIPNPGRPAPINASKGRLRERDGPLCHYCRVAEGTTVDEKIPRSQGGKRVMSNCVLACEACNGRKGSKSYEAFVARFRPPTPQRTLPPPQPLRPVGRTPSGITIWGREVDSSSKEV